ncbi:MAG: beta-ketoacyl-ACP synthase II, partial [Oscillospiraceae bacterium]
AITPIGCDVETFFENIKLRKHGFSFLEGSENKDVKIAAKAREFDPLKYFEKKMLRRTDPYCQFAMAAATDAVADCGTDFKDLDPFRVGVIVGSGIGGFQTIEDNHTNFLQKGNKGVSVFFVPMMICNMAAGSIAIKFGFKGANYAPVTACATSSHAIGEAFRNIKNGYLDVCLTGGSEAAITDFAIAGFDNMKALSHSTDLDRASIPFDAERDGFVMGEGSGILILEELEHALARNAKIYAEVVGYGATCDAYHITSPDPDGEGAKMAMTLAYQEAGLNACDIDYINAHGTSTGLNDKYETAAIKKAFPDKVPMVSSTKSMTGHLLGAAGAIEAIICAKSLQEGVVPSTVGYKVKDELCDLDYVTEGTRKAEIKTAISNSLGFGGHNASICFKKF